MGLFSIFEKESEHFFDKKDFIELVSCPRDGINCKDHRKVINKNISVALKHFNDKNFLDAISNLKNAYSETNHLKQETCIKCVELFRSTIIRSLENIHSDLERMSKGFFNKNKYQECYVQATKALNELKKQ